MAGVASIPSSPMAGPRGRPNRFRHRLLRNRESRFTKSLPIIADGPSATGHASCKIRSNGVNRPGSRPGRSVVVLANQPVFGDEYCATEPRLGDDDPVERISRPRLLQGRPCHIVEGKITDVNGTGTLQGANDRFRCDRQAADLEQILQLENDHRRQQYFVPGNQRSRQSRERSAGVFVKKHDDVRIKVDQFSTPRTNPCVRDLPGRRRLCRDGGSDFRKCSGLAEPARCGPTFLCVQSRRDGRYRAPHRVCDRCSAEGATQ